MTWSDAGTVASTLATIVAAGFTVASYFKKPPPMQPMRKGTAVQPPANNKQFVLIVGALALFSWCAVAFDYYERHQDRNFAYTAVVNQWGISNPLSYYLEANTAPLVELKHTQKLMLILRVPYGDVDRATDKRIEKSGTYTITGNAVMLVHGSSGSLRFAALQATPVEFNLVLLPSAISPDQIFSIDDVEHIGGKVLATTATSVIGGPPDTPPPPK
jgi:hypothetical protein